MKQIGKTLNGLIWAGLLAIGMASSAQTDSLSSINLSPTAIQSGALPLNSTNISSLAAWSDEQLTMLANALDATPTISAADMPNGGMGVACWSLQNPAMPPLPGDTVGLDGWLLSDGSVLLNDLNFDYSATPATEFSARPMTMMAMSAEGGLLPPGVGGGGAYSPDAITNTPPNYGTNLWIAQTAVASGYLNGIGSNTLADVPYEIQSRTNLAQQSDWQSEGFIYGSELANWTPLSVVQNNRTNLFIRLKSWQDDGSGLPIWWQMQYFGTTGVDPYALDSANDGYTIYQKYQMGVNPNVFKTPATPQGVTASLHQSSQTATVSWLPSAGSVTGYVVEKTDYNHASPVVQDSPMLSPSATSYTDVLAGNPLDYSSLAYDVTYKVRVVYGGSSSGWSAEVPVQPATVLGTFVPGTNGETYLEVAGVPANAATIQLGMWFSERVGDIGMYVTNNYNVAPSDLATGRYLLPVNWSPAVTAAQLPFGFFFGASLKSIDTNGNSSAATPVSGDWGTPFYDGRVQMKQNLIFQLRASPSYGPLSFYLATNGFDGFENDSALYQYPSNYVYAGFYPYAGLEAIGRYPGSMDVFLPFKENCLFRNFVFNLSDMDTNGSLTTGISYDLYYFAGTELAFPLTYLFQSGANPLPNLLATNNTRWLFPDSLDGNLYPNSGLFYLYISGADAPIAMSGGYANWFGLPYISAKVGYQLTDTQGNLNGVTGTAMLYPGTSLDLPFGTVNLYPETAQPQLQTVKYCFYRAEYDWLPGSQLFTPTNDSPMLIAWAANNSPYATNDQPFLIVPAGSWSQIAGYAKMAVQNGYPGVYGYLGQYLDKAYQMTNGVVTTNTTGMVSPYGNYFATQVGAAALVTMPDPDTQARGTCTVYSVALVLDKNHDGTMDGSFNGPDATSQASPMVWWINDDYDYSGASWNYGNDVQSSWYYNDGYQRKIDSQRDLEDYARLWICGVPALTNGNYQVTLSWANVSSGSPTINLFDTVETNGGIGYLTNLDTATAEAYNYGIWGENRNAIATISPGQPFTIPASYFTNAGDKHFLFDGAITNGAGELMLTIADGNGNTIAQTGAWLDLHDVRDFYERAVITNNVSGSISNWTSGIELVQPATASALGDDNEVIVFVHGFNVDNVNWLFDSDTVFKRLYWAGYRGKFVSVDWPCGKVSLNPYAFNTSEVNAYKAGTSMKTYLNQLRSRFPNYRLNILAHSQGNAVVSEAIKQGAPFDTYILTQGAVPASSYDVNASTDSTLLTAESSVPTPEWQQMGYHGVYTNLTGRIVNFYNEEDFALQTGTLLGGLFPVNWVKNQKSYKPSINYSYDGINCWYYFLLSGYQVTDSQESRANISRSRTDSVGATAGLGGVIQSSIDLHSQFQFSDLLDEHSAQWTRPIQTSRPYYQQVLVSFQIQPAP